MLPTQWPVLECKGRRMNESMDIIKFLDETFPDKPQLLSHGVRALGAPARRARLAGG